MNINIRFFFFSDDRETLEYDQFYSSDYFGGYMFQETELVEREDGKIFYIDEAKTLLGIEEIGIPERQLFCYPYKETDRLHLDLDEDISHGD